jgi:hypothetical protein
MKTDNTQILLPTDTLPFNTLPYNLNQVFCLAIQISLISGASDFYLQGSCDEGHVSAGGVVTGVSTWTDIEGSLKSLVAGDTLMYDFTNNGYNWVRLVCDGTGSATARINTKG